MHTMKLACPRSVQGVSPTPANHQPLATLGVCTPVWLALGRVGPGRRFRQALEVAEGYLSWQC